MPSSMVWSSELIKTIASRASTEGCTINAFNQNPKPHSHTCSVELSPAKCSFGYSDPFEPRTLLSYVWPGEPTPEEIGLFAPITSRSFVSRAWTLRLWCLLCRVLTFCFAVFAESFPVNNLVNQSML
jgi:hypothetical protein